MGESTVFDRQQLVDSTNGDEELAAQVVEIFFADIPEQLTELDQALQAGDAHTAERAAHSIKGASATIGGMALRETAFVCEKLGKDGKLEEMKGMLPVLRSDFAALCEQLRAAGFSG